MRKSGVCALALALAATVSVGSKSQAACDKENFKLNLENYFLKCYNVICDNLENLPGISDKLPCIPILPEKPETPDIPEVEIPDAPETPDVPEDKPIVPDVPEQPEEPENPTLPEVDNSVHAYEKQVLDLVNNERAKNGLSALEWSSELAVVARAHSQDMLERGFFSHTNPDGQSPFDRMRAAGISYRTAGENIAAGQRTPAEVVEAWMNSEGHRANILNASYTKLGVGYVSGNGAYSTYWTQNFAS